MMCQKKFVAYCERKHKNVKNEFLVMILNCYHFYKNNTEFKMNEDTFKNSYILKSGGKKHAILF